MTEADTSRSHRLPRRVATDLTRHPGDIVRLVTGVSLAIVGAVWAQQRRPDQLEVDLFRLINDLPRWLEPILVVPMQLGALVAVPVVALGAWALVGAARPAAS